MMVGRSTTPYKILMLPYFTLLYFTLLYLNSHRSRSRLIDLIDYTTTRGLHTH